MNIYKCQFCDNEVSEARFNLGYEWCMTKLCVYKGLYPARQSYVLVNNHKSNYEPMRLRR